MIFDMKKSIILLWCMSDAHETMVEPSSRSNIVIFFLAVYGIMGPRTYMKQSFGS